MSRAPITLEIRARGPVNGHMLMPGYVPPNCRRTKVEDPFTSTLLTNLSRNLNACQRNGATVQQRVALIAGTAAAIELGMAS